MKILSFAIAVSMAITSIAASAEQSAPRPDFKAALTAHLKAVTSRDLDAFEKTITESDDLYIIFPEGELIKSRKDIMDFHKQWFSDPNWQFDETIVKTIEGEDMSMALIKYDYSDKTNADPRTSWLVLVFKLEDGEWRLVHDQNTRIKPTP